MDRKRVFKLMLMGRITAAEAERLMAAWQAGRERAWILVGCIGIGMMVALQMGALPVVHHVVHSLRAAEWMRAEWLHSAAAMVMRPGYFS